LKFFAQAYLKRVTEFLRLRLTKIHFLSLTNEDNRPCKILQINPDNSDSIYCGGEDFEFGPIFGFGFDIYVCDSANTTASCYTNLSVSYQHPQSSDGVPFLAGSQYFQLSEIEVYQRE
jgi:hypothetical protein